MNPTTMLANDASALPANGTSPDPVADTGDRAIRSAEPAIATKLMAAWLTNRRQTLMPHTLNFRALAPREVGLLIETMAAAAQADGIVDTAERHQATLALALVGADQGEIERHAQALLVPQPVSRILTDVREARIGAHAYASALLAIDRASPACQAFLAYVAARLALPPDLAHALESRYRA